MTSTRRHEHPDELRIRRRFLLLTALRWFPGGLVLPVLVLLMQSRGLTLAQVGGLFAGFTVLTAVWELPTGALADVIGRRRVLISSSVLTVVAFTLFAIAQSLLVFAFGFIAFSMGRALSSGPLQSWYVDEVSAIQPDADIRTALAREGLVSSLAIGAAAVLGGAIPGLSQRVIPNLPTGGSAFFTSLTLPVWLAAALLSVATGAIALLMTSSRTETIEPTETRILDVLSSVREGLALASRESDIRVILLAVAAIGFAMSATELIAPAFIEHLTRSSERATATYGVLVTVSFVAGGLGSAGAPVIGRVVGGAMRGAAVAVLIGAFAFAALGLSTGIALVVACYVGIYLAVGAAAPLHLEQLHHRVSSSHRATMLSVQSMAMMLGATLGSLAVGGLVQKFNYPVGWSACALALLLAAALSVRIRDKNRPAHADPPVERT